MLPQYDLINAGKALINVDLFQTFIQQFNLIQLIRQSRQEQTCRPNLMKVLQVRAVTWL